MTNIQITSEMTKELKPNRIKVLEVIASNTNESGIAHLTVKQISTKAMISKPTTINAINDLMEYGLLEREVVQEGKVKTTYYKVKAHGKDSILQGKENSEIGVKTLPSEPETDFTDAGEVAEYFRRKFKLQFGVEYKNIRGKELNIIKSKLIPNHKPKQLKQLIDVLIENYQDKWGSSQFPYPVIAHLNSYTNTGKQVKAFIENGGALSSGEIKAKTEASDKENDAVLNRILKMSCMFAREREANGTPVTLGKGLMLNDDGSISRDAVRNNAVVSERIVSIDGEEMLIEVTVIEDNKGNLVLRDLHGKEFDEYEDKYY